MINNADAYRSDRSVSGWQPEGLSHAPSDDAGGKGEPVSRRAVLTHSGHLAHFEVPDEFNRIVLDFLKAIE